MTNINPFFDKRPIPKVSINVKVKIKTKSAEENIAWNKAFGYIMKKQRSKLDFIYTEAIRKIDNLEYIKLEDIHKYIQEPDYDVLKTIEDIFNTRLTKDNKSFILSVLHIDISTLKQLSESLSI